MMKRVINIDDLEFHEHEHGESFKASGAQVSDELGAVRLGYSVTVVPPGKRAWPFHNHHANEEMFEYPDSNKFSASTVLPGVPGGFRLLGEKHDSVDYWLGEN
jgi:hypothetical protein